MLMQPDEILDLLVDQEGLKLKPYRDTKGYLTVGVGRNLDTVGLTREEALYLGRNDVKRARESAKQSFPWFMDLSPVRQGVITILVFNLGLLEFKGFRKMIAAIERKDFEKATDELLDSKWRKDVGEKRAGALAKMLRTDQAV